MQVTRYNTSSRPRPFTSERLRKIEQRRRQERRDNIKNWLLIAGLVACYLAAGYIDGQSIQQGLL